jgi:hypothetical protein
MRRVPLVLLVLLLPWCAWPQNPATLTVTPDRTSLMVGERLQVNVTADGPGVSNQGPFSLPNLAPNLQLLRTNGPQVQQSFQIINGRPYKFGNISMSYVFEARVAGRVTIPALQYRAGSQLIASAPVTIEVTEGHNANLDPGDSAWTPPTDPYLEVKLSQREAYVGEQIVVSWFLYNRHDLGDLSLRKIPTAGDFTLADLGQVNQLNPVAKMLGDGQWQVSYLKSSAIFPIKAGELALDELALNFSRQSRERDFFGNFIMLSDTLASPPTKITVKPLPEKGKPDDFAGAVGNFTATLDKNSGRIAADEQFKFTLTIAGDGHPDFVPKPTLELPNGFDLYTESADKNITNQQGRALGVRQFKMIIVPHVPGEFDLGPFHFSYFDPKTKTYRQAESQRLHLSVAPGAAGENGKNAAPVTVTAVGTDLRFIKLDPIGGDQGRWLLRSPALLLAQSVPLLALAAALGIRHRRDRLVRDVAYARRLRAGKVSRQCLKRAKKALAHGETDAVYAQVQQALTCYVADRCNLPEAGMTTADAAAALRQAGISEEQSVRVEKLLASCDQARFAPGAMKDQDAGPMLEQAETLLKGLAKDNGA